MRALNTQSNFGEKEKTAWMVRKFIELGYTTSTTPEAAGQLYKKFFEDQLRDYNLQDSQEFSGIADMWEQMIKEDIEGGSKGHLQPLLAAELKKKKVKTRGRSSSLSTSSSSVNTRRTRSSPPLSRTSATARVEEASSRP